MLFRCRRTYSAYPSLPSAYDNIFRLRFVTIGRREARETGEGGRSDPNEVDKLRAEADHQMRQYGQRLSTANVPCGDSVVREYHVLGERHYFLEQEVAISMHLKNAAWTALVCSDIGSNLAEGFPGPWLSQEDRESNSISGTTFYPTIQHRKRLSLRSRPVLDAEQSPLDKKFPQTASLLAFDYGHFLDKSAMSSDPFYALDDLFRFFANSENQLLNLIEWYVGNDTGHRSLTNDKPSVSGLVYYQEILETHVGRLRQLAEVVRRRGGTQWPRAPQQEKHAYNKAEDAAVNLLRDIEYLQRRADDIRKRCERGIAVIMNNLNLAESKRAMSQAKLLTKLTIMAFIYIPLSFTTSFFGMNLVRVGTGMRAMCIWLGASALVVLLTIAVYYMERIQKGVGKWLSRRRHGRQEHKVENMA
ncbi:uncharacterized protein LTR77_004226 [Saxophila tyrrhenica]|uniref:Uncharacterized protein n=1 Tax=Saxophila tyrrhenica TaxID=1690608 RepID=A0AAV9PF40_9PEZI|nr:hypothetical protein LTR77_004226 [Saxophila tyrrhenica]